MVPWAKKQCPHCLSETVKRRGTYASGRTRWFCNTCRRSFCWRRDDARVRRERIWFERWIIEGYSVRQLVLQSGHSRDKLYRVINHWLQRIPEPDTSSLEAVQHIILDGSFLHRPKSLVVVMDAETNTVLCGVYGISENSESQLTSFLTPLRARGLSPVSCTMDGNPQAMRVVRTVWPEIIVQRCLVHIQRQGLKWCRAHPKRPDARRLREIFRGVTYIRTSDERNHFTSQVTAWEERHGKAVASQPERGRVFSDLKRARSMLLKALPDMFHYLDNSRIALSTNGLEGYFSRLKAGYRQHRGLHPAKRSNYFSWYFKLRPK